MALPVQQFNPVNYLRSTREPDISPFTEFLHTMKEEGYRPAMLEQAFQRGEQSLRKGEADIGLTQEQTRNAALQRALREKYGEQQQQFGFEQQKTKSLLNQLNAEKLMRELRREDEMHAADGGGRENALFMGSVPKNAQLLYRKKMVDEATKAESGKEILKLLKDARGIITKHPDMADYFEQIVSADKTDKPSFLKQASRKIVNKDKLAAIEKFIKVSNDIQLKAGESFGTNFTDAKLKAIENSKMSAKNTAEANKAVIDSLTHHYSYAPEYAKDLRWAMKNNYYLMPDYDTYRNKYLTEAERELGQQFDGMNTLIAQPDLSQMSTEELLTMFRGQ